MRDILILEFLPRRVMAYDDVIGETRLGNMLYVAVLIGNGDF